MNGPIQISGKGLSAENYGNNSEQCQINDREYISFFLSKDFNQSRSTYPKIIKPVTSTPLQIWKGIGKEDIKLVLA